MPYNNVDIERAKKIASFGLCDTCLGIVFRDVEGESSRERGKKVREELGIEESRECWMCDGVMNDIEKLASMAMDALKEYEFDTFLVGCIVDDEILKKEKRLGIEEGVKREINREIGKIIEERTGKEVDFKLPDINIIVDTICYNIEIKSRAIYIYGRYRKLIRGIPQTKWPCRHCNGIGCIHCNFTGKMYRESVEEIIAHEPVKIFEAKDESFHGAGREDIDVLMLGNGRPFILELKEPRKRKVSLKMLEEKINEFASGKVEVYGLRYVDRKEIEKIKSAKYPKIYRVVVEYTNKENLQKAVNAMVGITINQRTPKRVMHRRADLVRRRKILDMKLEKAENGIADIVVKAESGTYIKEMVTGDEGRTTPSLSQLAGEEIKVVSLDVIGIGD